MTDCVEEETFIHWASLLEAVAAFEKTRAERESSWVRPEPAEGERVAWELTEQRRAGPKLRQ